MGYNASADVVHRIQHGKCDIRMENIRKTCKSGSFTKCHTVATADFVRKIRNMITFVD
jgi:hypothetical protein